MKKIKDINSLFVATFGLLVIGAMISIGCVSATGDATKKSDSAQSTKAKAGATSELVDGVDALPANAKSRVRNAEKAAADMEKAADALANEAFAKGTNGKVKNMEKAAADMEKAADALADQAFSEDAFGNAKKAEEAAAKAQQAAEELANEALMNVDDK
ncbi:hypothetical protein SCOR_30790 [Sulfidibacter corallicola]|uniref:Uncharacterized protein n=1 Tax=Sulfidibacter corallicola TaxID=2818388 RepID=A0A8A4TJ53_SULCO|nr:hypothetical protein [Sulfidibacter corallicola]QTD50059.1 hypothetical protein J3U87_31125 [Sulfidibacter corallicola]